VARPYLTVWRVINRLRSIAEHAGCSVPKWRLTPTRSAVTGRRFFLVPFHIGWHLATHVDAGVPMAHLPGFHAELRRAATSPTDWSTALHVALAQALERATL